VKKFTYILLVVVFAGILVACSAAAKTTATPSPESEVAAAEPASLLGEQAVVEPACIANPPQPTPNPQEVELYTPDPEKDWILGPEDAPVTVVEYGDFQCPYCAQAAVNLKALLERFPQDVRFVYRHFPLASIHDKAILAVQGAEAAGKQGEDFFWAMHDMLYETQSTWSSFSAQEFTDWMIEVASQLGMDRAQFESDLLSDEIASFAASTWTDGQAIGLSGTPTIIFNNLYRANGDPDTLNAYVELIKLEGQQFSECPPLTVDPEATYLATVVTDKGSFVIQLFPDVAPLAVNSFIFLVEHGWFDGITFHRVLPGFVAQSGDPTGTGYGGPGYTFKNEVSDDLSFDRAGLVAMANAGPDSNGSQFFITYDAVPDLNGNYTIFGEVVEGMDVVENITPRDPQPGLDLPPGDRILSITIEKQ
jgi:cyclophilin family peptidyl-prolyl cis-trans isomerase/protein-disulfide isomerase